MERTGSAFGLADWTVIAAYMAVIIGIGALSARKQHGTADFFLGGRSMPSWAVALSVLATSLSAATFIGVPQMAFESNLSYLILNLGAIIAAFIVAFVIIPPIYRSGTTTIYGYLAIRYGTGSAIAASGVFLVGRLLASGARLYMAAIAFSLMLYGDIALSSLVMAVLLLGVIGTLYTVCGGIRAVIWTDVLQIIAVVFVVGLSILVLVAAIPLPVSGIVEALRGANGTDKLQIVDTRLDWGLNYTLWTGLIAATFLYTASFGVDHDLAQRLLTTRTSLHGSMAMIASTVLSVPVIFLFLVVGLLLSIFYGRPELMGEAMPPDMVADSRKVYPQFLLNHLPAGLRGLSMAGLFAAAMSSFDSAINAMAGTALADIYVPWKRLQGQAPSPDSHEVRNSRLAVTAMGVLLTAFAIGAIYLQTMGSQTLIDFALGVMAFALAPMLGVFMTALLTRRGNTRSVIAALALGACIVLLLQPYMLQTWLGFELGWPWFWVIAGVCSFGICCAGSPKDAAEA